MKRVLKTMPRALLTVLCVLTLAFAVLTGTTLLSTTTVAVAEPASVDLSAIEADYVAQDGDTLTGTLSGRYKISVADGATVTLSGATINLSSHSSSKWAGITLEGDGTLVLSGTNTLKGCYDSYPGIFVPENKTLTIQGDGSLIASSYSGAGIGGINSSFGPNCGSIVIKSGTITASSSSQSAGIGATYNCSCGDITIEGGIVTATGGEYAAGIGSGYTGSTCGNITISGGTVTATGGSHGAGIGAGYYNSSTNVSTRCGDITISGGTVTATGGEGAAGIGGGKQGCQCGNITIADTVTEIAASKGSGATYSIGRGKDNYNVCGTVTIAGVEGQIATSPYNFVVTTVMLDPNGGTGDNSVNAISGNAMPTIDSADLPTRTDYTFVGYYDAQTGGTKYYNADGTSAKNWDKSDTTATLYAHWENSYPVSIAAGQGVESVYLSTSSTATSGAASGTAFPYGSTVYGFATLKTGYQANYGWVLVCGTENTEGAIYQVGSKTASSAQNFGYIVATPKTYPVTLERLSDPIIVTFDADMPQLTTLPVKEGYTLVGYWDEDGTTQYYDENGESTHKWDLDGTDFTLVAHWTKDMTVTSSGYEADYDGSAHGITITVTDPENYTIYYESATDNYNLTEAPTYTNTGEYTVNFKIVEAEYTDYYGSETVVIKEVDKEELKTLINNCDDYYNSIKNDYSSIADDFNNAINDAKAIRDNVNVTSEEVSNTITALTTALNIAKADVTKTKITAIGTFEYTDACKALIDDARKTYDALTADQKELVTNYQTLLDAESTYAGLRTNAVNNAIDKIDNINLPLAYPTSGIELSAARSTFDALVEVDQNVNVVTNYQDLLDLEAVYAIVVEINEIGESEDTQDFRNKVTKARSHYNALTDTQKSLFPDKEEHMLDDYEAAIAVMDKINDIGTVEYTDASKAKIDEAREAYDALTADQKAMVVNYETLTDAEATYKGLDDQAKADVVKTLINNIGTVEYTATSKAKIDEAREGYEALTEDQKALVTNYQDLTNAEATYADLRTTAITNVYNMIDSINVPLVYPTSEEEIGNARDAFDALVEVDQTATVVTNYPDLLDIEAAYAVVVEVATIGESEDTQDFRDKVEAARSNYNALTDTQKSLFPDKEEHLLDDYEAAIAVMDKINAIGTVEYTATSKAKIDEARTSYDALTADQKAMVANYQKLLDAESAYAGLRTTAVNNAYDKIDNINVPLVYPESEDELTAAREAFDALVEADQNATVVTNYPDLLDLETVYPVVEEVNAIGDVEDTQDFRDKVTAARNHYNALTDTQESLFPDKEEHMLDDYEAAIAVMDKINAIGTVAYNATSKALIDEARTLYDALTDTQKALITNYQGLVKFENDYQAIDKVVNEINNLVKITYNDNSNKKITDARKAYNELTKDQNNIFPEETKKTLENYENAYLVLAKIYSIGEVEYTEESEQLIADARKDYDALNGTEKGLISDEDLAILTNAEDSYNSKSTAGVVWFVILLILVLTAIGFGIFFIFLLLRKKDNKTQKAMSVSPFGVIFLASHLADGKFITLYVFAGLALAIWIAVLVIYILKKKNIIMASNSNVAAIELDDNQTLDLTNDEEENKKDEELVETDEVLDEDIETVTDSSGNTFKIQYIKSFKAKLIQSNDEIKNQYIELKKEILSYQGTKSKITWHFETISIGRDVLLRFAIRGKTLCIYYALNSDEYNDSKYKVENITTKKHSSAPCLYRIKNERRFGYAKELIKDLANKNNLVIGNEPTDNYYLPYEERDVLIEQGLIKKNEVKINN